jgi:hypothetical protein
MGCLIKREATKAYRVVEIQLYALLTSAMVEGRRF